MNLWGMTAKKSKRKLKKFLHITNLLGKKIGKKQERSLRKHITITQMITG